MRQGARSLNRSRACLPTTRCADATIIFLYIYTYIYQRSEFTSYLKAMKASPISPPIMCTPPSGIERPVKKFRMSRAFAVHGRFCKRIMTLILIQEFCFNLFVIDFFSFGCLQPILSPNRVTTNLNLRVVFYTKHTSISLI